MKKANSTPIERTVQHHQAKNQEGNAVNLALGFPFGEAFDKDLTELLDSDLESTGMNLIVALIDLDNFDHINKDFGIEEGDRVLIETGRYIRESSPKTAKVYRIGGDEFGIVFVGTEEKEDIFLFLEGLRRDFPVVAKNDEPISITIGMATAFEDANRTPELIRKADSALFRAKVNGRNRVAMAKEEKMVPKTSHYTQDQLQRLAVLAKHEGVGEAILLREALDMLLKKYDKMI